MTELANFGSAAAQGALVIIGGAEDRSGDCKILRAFWRLAGGRAAQIVILTAATSEPQEAGETYIDLFGRLGAASVVAVDTRSPNDANHVNAVRALNQATGIFFTGGDQSRIVERIRGTLLEDAIQMRHAGGAVVAGTSAGAAIMPEVMILRGDSETSPRGDGVTLGVGLGFVSGILVDQHFAQRGRLGRLLTALLLKPDTIGVGVDENTALIVQGDEFEVLGEGAVTVVDESEISYNNLDSVWRDEAMSMFGVRLHVLSEGCRFNIQTRQPFPAPRSA
ncbi:MAG: cyanophycinase [Pegethrix bostrychoides GSE-TBD4-15B]|jgi:cyanophycinase|uniref:Cyanophycinase n=1 Tax=Pegethrix bostrychoides GSE-TBD4-15B TaxID=2839662 RepID=A0A951PDX4_9CYAN|nr:cyanophycinase [Pegethrix bostrychoides GSE-TBD4-15B]